MSRRLLYVHDYPFQTLDKSKPQFEVGMPASYFKRFLQNNFSVDIFSRIRRPVSDSGKFSDIDVRLSKLCAPTYAECFLSLLRLRKGLGSYSFAVVNYPSINGLMWLLLYRNKIPYVVEHVNDNNAFSSKVGGGLLKRIFCYVEGPVFSKALGVTAVSGYLKNRYYPELNLTASNVDISVPAFIERTPGGALTVLSVGAVSRKKGIDLVLKQLLDVGRPVEYLVIGEQRDLRFKSSVLRLSDMVTVRFLGVLDKTTVLNYLRSAHIFVQASRSEGLPRAVIEAMAYSLPVVSSRLECFGGLVSPELMIDFEKKGSFNSALEWVAQKQNYSFISRENHSKARAYDSDALTLKRREFYKEISDVLYDLRKG